MRQEASMKFEADMTAQLLPRCRACRHPHPLALSPPAAADVCPNCGGPASPPGEVRKVDAETGPDPFMLAGRALLAIGRFFHNLAKGIR